MARPSTVANVLFFIFLLLLIYPGSSPSSDVIHHSAESIAKDRDALNVLHNTTWEDLNLPYWKPDQSLPLHGFRPEDGFNWHFAPLLWEKLLRRAGSATMGESVTLDSGLTNRTVLLYQNVTGWVRGEWVRVNPHEALKEGIVRGDINSTSIASRVEQSGRSLTHNITGKGGNLQIRFAERQDDDGLESESYYNAISAKVQVQDESSYADGWSWSMHGIHHRGSGSVILASSTNALSGIFALPHLTLSPFAFNESKTFLEGYLNRTMTIAQNNPDNPSARPWSSASLDSDEALYAPSCQLVTWIQQYRLPFIDHKSKEKFADRASSAQATRESFALIEEEIRFPTGIWSSNPPPLHFSSVLFSPDCGFVLETKGPPDYAPSEAEHLQGMRYEVRVSQGKTVMFSMIVVLIGQILLLIEQINDSSTPSKKSRISFWTLVMLSLGDGFVAFGSLFLSSFSPRLYILSLAIAFLAFMGGLYFAMRFLLEVWSIQEPERMEQARDRRRARQARTTTSSANQSGSQQGHSQHNVTALPQDTGAAALPVPVVAGATVPTATTTDAAESITFGAVYTRYCLFLLSTVFFSLWAATSWPTSARSLYANILLLFYLSFWMPQIYRNIMRNCRQALSKKFVIGQSLLRLVPIAYFWGYEHNVLFVRTDLRMLATFAGWLWVQVVLLFGQELLGPRFLVSEKSSWVPAAWDYHPMLREDEEGSAMPIGDSPSSPVDERRSSLDAASKADRRGSRMFDCAICMQRIEVPVVPAGESPASGNSATDMFTGGYIARSHYSVTPCRHIFHSDCLENSMDYKLSCPVCREHLPPR